MRFFNQNYYFKRNGVPKLTKIKKYVMTSKNDVINIWRHFLTSLDRYLWDEYILKVWCWLLYCINSYYKINFIIFCKDLWQNDRWFPVIAYNFGCTTRFFYKKPHFLGETSSFLAKLEFQVSSFLGSFLTFGQIIL